MTIRRVLVTKLGRDTMTATLQTKFSNSLHCMKFSKKSYLIKVTPLMRGKMTPLCRRHFEINFNEWKLLYFDLTFFRVCSTSTHELGYHVSRAVVTQAGQLWPIWPNLANLTGKLQTTFFQWKYLNTDWYYIEVCFKGIIYNKSALHCFVVLIEMSFQLL